MYTFDRTTKINIVDIMAANSVADAGVAPLDADDGPPTATYLKNYSSTQNLMKFHPSNCYTTIIIAGI